MRLNLSRNWHIVVSYAMNAVTMTAALLIAKAGAASSEEIVTRKLTIVDSHGRAQIELASDWHGTRIKVVGVGGKSAVIAPNVIALLDHNASVVSLASGGTGTVPRVSVSSSNGRVGCSLEMDDELGGRVVLYGKDEAKKVITPDE
jgi:hypothetical protein